FSLEERLYGQEDAHGVTTARADALDRRQRRLLVRQRRLLIGFVTTAGQGYVGGRCPSAHRELLRAQRTSFALRARSVRRATLAGSRGHSAAQGDPEGCFPPRRHREPGRSLRRASRPVLVALFLGWRPATHRLHL